MSAKEPVVPYGDDAAPYDNDDLSAFADQVRHDYGWCFDSDRAQAARWLATVDALRAERDEAVALLKEAGSALAYQSYFKPLVERVKTFIERSAP
jgi:hypothetical protein